MKEFFGGSDYCSCKNFSMKGKREVGAIAIEESGMSKEGL